MTKQIISSVYIVSFLLANVYSHPQCLDFKPPFKSKTQDEFCHQYSNFGCCTKVQDSDIEKRFELFRSNLSSDTWNRCSRILKELMCQECSPYAAHIYGVEDTMGVNPFPGLCTSYCETLFDTDCMELVPLIDPNLSKKVDLNIKSDFCNHVKNADIDYCFPELLDNPILNNNVSNTQITAEGCLCLEQHFSGLRNPIFARSPPDGSNRLIVGEQIGLIHVGYPQDKELLPTPLLNITSQVKTTDREGDERGLFQIAFHPKFLTTNKFYLYYSTYLNDQDRAEHANKNDDAPLDHKIRISEFVISELDENIADPQSERVILEVLQPYWNHNGGELIFGDDGFLYIFIGDGGHREDPHNFAQNRSVLLGKVLRIDVDTKDVNIPYLIPSDNPYLGMEGIREEIYSYGVRNIWRCGKDLGSGETDPNKGRIVCGDVGQDAFEEIDLIKKGANYGWNVWEGNDCFNNNTDICNHHGPLEKPIFDYPHRIGKSVTGGEFYRGCQNPNLNGLYIYGDFMSGRLFGLRQDSVTKEWTNKELFMCGADYCKNGLTGRYDQHIISFGVDESAEVFMLTTQRATTTGMTGNIYKFVDPIRRGNPDDCSVSNGNMPTSSTTREPFSSDSPVIGDGRNIGPQIHNMNIRTCSMASTLLCTLLTMRA